LKYYFFPALKRVGRDAAMARLGKTRKIFMSEKKQKHIDNFYRLVVVLSLAGLLGSLYAIQKYAGDNKTALMLGAIVIIFGLIVKFAFYIFRKKKSQE
jgi:hypothetical protein